MVRLLSYIGSIALYSVLSIIYYSRWSSENASSMTFSQIFYAFVHLVVPEDILFEDRTSVISKYFLQVIIFYSLSWYETVTMAA